MIEALEQFRPHQEELRRRLIRSFLAVVLTSSVAYLFKETLAAWCIHPLKRAYPPLEKLVYTNLPEAFLSYIKLSLLVGLVVASPFVLYQVWLFVAPGLLDKEKRMVRRVVLWATLLFAAGGAFGFAFALGRRCRRRGTGHRRFALGGRRGRGVFLSSGLILD